MERHSDTIALNFVIGAKIDPVWLTGVTYQVRAIVNAGTSTLMFTKDGGGYLTLAEGEALLNTLRYNKTSNALDEKQCQFAHILNGRIFRK